jgi:hypothetical protein
MDEQLLNAKEVMKILNISRAFFYTKVICDNDFVNSVSPVSLTINGQKQYKKSELIDFINIKQLKTV